MTTDAASHLPARLPGSRVRTTGRPLMAALDLLGRRWALRILWEFAPGPLGRPGVARALRQHVVERALRAARRARRARLVDQDDDGTYALTQLGRRPRRCHRSVAALGRTLVDVAPPSPGGEPADRG